MKKLYNKKWQDIFGKRRLRLLIGLVPICIFLFTGNLWTLPAHAATLCVNTGGTNGCHAMPSAAVALAVAGDTILVRSGTYMETGSINITKANLKIIGDNPSNTIVQNSVPASVFVLTLTADNIEIANLTITGGRHGIELVSGTTGAVIHHNIIGNNGLSGISQSGGYGSRSIIAFNNVIHTNNEYGINVYPGAYANDSIIYNNIVFKNANCGIYSGTVSYNSSYDNKNPGSPLSSNFCSIIGNIGNISQNCLFVDETANDYRLQPSSTCKNTGNPGYLDVDGTRSDMGSFGGPSAALFWPYGNGGPIVTNLTVDPPYVPQGGTLSIKGTVEIR